MHTLGIHTVGQLHNIPENILVELFGPSIRSILTLVGFTQKPVREVARVRTADVTAEKPTLRKRLRLATQVMSLL
jgi:hypothetical protein